MLPHHAYRVCPVGLLDATPVHEKLMLEAGATLSQFLRDHTPVPLGAVERGCQAVYLDDEVFLSVDKESARLDLHRAGEALHAAGLPTHEVEEPSLEQVFWGPSSTVHEESYGSHIGATGRLG